MFNEVKFYDGKVLLIDNGDYLKEDLLQVQYDEKLIDVGWYNQLGAFVIYIIHDEDWEHPLKEIVCKEDDEMIATLQMIINNLKA